MKISIIAAIGKNRELGKANKLLWHIPEDMKRFKKLTSGHVVIMGQRTFESIGKSLPNRLNIILSHESGVFSLDSRLRGNDKTITKVVSSIDEALENASRYTLHVTRPEVFIIGGGMIYKQFLPLADKLYLTLVEGTYDADTFFPEYEKLFTKKVFEEKHDNGKNKFIFIELQKHF